MVEGLKARTNNSYSHQPFGQLSLEPQDSRGVGWAYVF